MSKKYLLVTSDDFGISHSVNQGILQGFQRGLVRSSNFMAAAPWFPEAARLAKTHQLPIGVHVTLTSEWTNMSCAPITGAKSLTNELGYFYSDYQSLLPTIDIEDVKNEYRAQINRVIASGIQPTHIDSHMLIDLSYPGSETYQFIADAIEEVAAEYGLIYTYAMNNGKLKYFDQRFELTHKTLEQVTDVLVQFESGIFHIICHCALDNEEQQALALSDESVYRWASKVRQNDLDIVSSLEFKNFVEEQGFEVIDIHKVIELNQR